MRKSIFPVAILATLVLSPLKADSPDPTIREPGVNAPAARAIQGVPGGVPVNISGTINASSSCHATALAPTYVEATDNALSCDLAGTLRTSAGGGGGGSSDVAIHDNTTPTRHLAVDASGQIGVNNFPASQAVTGTFWQATQPVSGTFWQATQPVSSTQLPAALDGLDFKVHEQGTVPVTGTFWQSTQPVSGPLTDTQLRASAVPVSGTFWQATQPVSGSVSVSNFPASQAVTGTFWQATQPVSSPDVSVSGTIASATCPGTGCFDVTLGGGKTSCLVHITGTWTGTIQARVSGNASTQSTVNLFSTASALANTSVTANGNFFVRVGGAQTLRLDGTSSWTSGTATIAGVCGTGDDGMSQYSYVRIQDPSFQGLSANVLANDTTAAGSGLETQPGIAKAGPAATTAGRSEKLQLDTVSGGVYGTESPTTANVALSQKVVSVNTTTNVKASAGNVYGVSCSNANASVCFLQFYNTAGSPTCGTSVIWSLAIPTSGVLNFGLGPLALANHATGIGVCMGTTNTGATACTTANSCTIFYK